MAPIKSTIKVTQYQLRVITKMAGPGGTDSEGLANIFNLAKVASPAFQRLCDSEVGPDIKTYNQRYGRSF